MLQFARKHLTVILDEERHCCAKGTNCLSFNFVASFQKPPSLTFWGPTHWIHCSMFFHQAQIHTLLIKSDNAILILICCKWNSFGHGDDFILHSSSDFLFHEHTEIHMTHPVMLQLRMCGQVWKKFSQVPTHPWNCVEHIMHRSSSFQNLVKNWISCLPYNAQFSPSVIGSTVSRHVTNFCICFQILSSWCPPTSWIILRVYASPSGFFQPFENMHTIQSFIFIYSFKHFIYHSGLPPSFKQNLCLFNAAWQQTRAHVCERFCG